MEQHRYETHITILGWLNIACGALFFFLGILAFAFLTGVGLVADDPNAARILAVTGISVAALFVGLSVPGILAGLGLLLRRPWGRILAIVVAAFNLFNVPIGTAIGIYALVILMDDQARDFF